jgi:hypothetical protein
VPAHCSRGSGDVACPSMRTRVFRAREVGRAHKARWRKPRDQIRVTAYFPEPPAGRDRRAAPRSRVSSPAGVPPVRGLAVVLRNGKPGADAPGFTISPLRGWESRPALETLVHLPAQKKQRAQASQDDAIKINFSPRPGRAASPCLRDSRRFVTSGRQRALRVTSKKVLARKWRPPFF